MAILSHETDHEARLYELLPLQYHETPNWQILMVRFWSLELQRLEDAVDDLLTEFRLNSATGSWLDLWGSLLQFPRPDEIADPDYLSMLQGRALALRGAGSISAVVEAAGLLVNNPATGPVARIIETPPGSAVVQLEAIAQPYLRGPFGAIMYSTAPVGVRLLVVEALSYPGDDEGLDILAPDLQAAFDARTANTFRVTHQIWTLDEINLGWLRDDMMGDCLI